MTDDDHNDESREASAVGPNMGSALRLLPWTTPEGKSVFLRSNGGFLSQYADQVEDLQLDMAKALLDVVPTVLDNPESGPEELRYAGKRLTESLTEALRVARSRGMRSLVAAMVGNEGDPEASPGG